MKICFITLGQEPKRSGFKLFDTQMLFLKEFFEKVDFEKNQPTTAKHAKNYPAGKELKQPITSY